MQTEMQTCQWKWRHANGNGVTPRDRERSGTETKTYVEGDTSVWKPLTWSVGVECEHVQACCSRRVFWCHRKRSSPCSTGDKVKSKPWLRLEAKAIEKMQEETPLWKIGRNCYIQTCTPATQGRCLLLCLVEAKRDWYLHKNSSHASQHTCCRM